ncbi:aspartate aminotransferase family protein [Bryobacter aggregatus]|uniref:aspartate aminotransferase family protein n=1 Tax=Bryobacter aggregatus TaxID=360054 RepID=UPI0004E21E4F|nr:aspartate aminotransferase family protein [Bryobacter aggregatus]
MKLDEIQELEKSYLLQNYARYPLALASGKGVYVYDVEGNKYLDLLSGIGVNSLGHNHPRITKVIREQSAKLLHTSNLYYHEYQGKLAKKLTEVSGMDRAFFCNSGTEAVEGALKIARSHGRKIRPEKFHLIALENSFHGRTFGALSVTGQPKYRHDFEPLLPGVTFIQRDDEAALEAAFHENTAGIILEGIQGEGGVLPVSNSFLEKARALCDQFDAILIHDGIQCGVGRPGTYFSYQNLERPVFPDVVAFAKPISCGLPMGGILMKQRAADSLGAGMHGTTFGGGPLVCRVALEFFDILDDLLPHIRKTGEYFREELRELGKKHSFVKEVRGAGLIIGVELDMECKKMVTDGFEQGLLFNVTHDTVLRFLPAYILKEKHVDKAIKGLKKIFAKY